MARMNEIHELRATPSQEAPASTRSMSGSAHELIPAVNSYLQLYLQYIPARGRPPVPRSSCKLRDSHAGALSKSTVIPLSGTNWRVSVRNLCTARVLSASVVGIRCRQGTSRARLHRSGGKGKREVKGEIGQTDRSKQKTGKEGGAGGKSWPSAQASWSGATWKNCLGYPIRSSQRVPTCGASAVRPAR